MLKISTRLLCFFFLFCGIQISSIAQEGATCATAVVVNALPFSDPNFTSIPPDATPPNTCTSGNNYNENSACSNTYMTANDFVYRFTPTMAADACINITASTVANADLIAPAIFVVEGCPDDPLARCVAQEIEPTPQPITASQYNTVMSNVQLEVGKTYYIVISGLNDAANNPCFTFNLNITRSTACRASRPGEDCLSATSFTTLPYKHTGQSSCGNKNYINDGNSCTFTYLSGSDYIYRFTPDKDYCAGIRVTTDEVFSSLSLFENCPTDANKTCIRTVFYTGFAPLSINYNFEQGKDYYIVLSSDTPGFYQNDCLDFELQVSAFTDLGKDCSKPIVVPALPFSETNTTACKGDDFDNAGGCLTFYQAGDEVIYTYNSPGNECVSVNLTDIRDNNVGLYIFDRCPELPGAVCLAAGSGGPFGNDVHADYTVGAAQTLYIAVSANLDFYVANYDISITNLPVIGNTCANPITVPSLPFQDTNNTACKGDDFDNVGTCNTFFQNGNETVYTYTSAGNECIGIQLNNTSRVYGAISIFDQCPETPGATCLANTISTIPVNGKPGYAALDYTITAPTTLYITVSNAYLDDEFQYELSIAPLTQDGKDCSNPIVISTNSYQEHHTVLCKGDDIDTTGACPRAFNQNIDGKEIVYTYNSPGNECVSLNIRNITTESSTVYIFDRCPSDPAAQCIASDFRSAYTNTDPSYQFEFLVTTPINYYILIGSTDNNENPSYDFEFKANPIDPAGAVCATAFTVGPAPFSGSYSIGCKQNDYTPTMASKSLYTGSSDVVLKYVVTNEECVAIVTKMDNRGGIFVMNDCPDAPGVQTLVSGICEGDCDSVILEYTFAPGTYYILLDAYEGVLDMNFDIQIRPNGKKAAGTECLDCGDDICIACQNASLERGSLADWVGATGKYMTPAQTPGLTFKTINDPFSRHTIVSAGGYDPVVGPELSFKSPAGSRYAVRLGNRNRNAEAEVLRYTYTVDSASKNFYYYYAVVFDDSPGHSKNPNTGNAKPYLLFKMFDENNEEITCSTYEVYADKNDPSFNRVNAARFKEYNDSINYYNEYVIWKNWTLVSVPLDDYIGKTITIEFTNKDCQADGHYGYCYLDAFCGNIPFKTSTKYLCKDKSISITAPPGFNGYLWDNGATTQTITVNEARTYTVTLTTVSSCTLDLDFEVKGGEVPIPNFSKDQICGINKVYFIDSTSLSANDTSHVSGWEWDFGDGSPKSILQNPEHQYTAPGNYTVRLVSNSSNGCADTLVKAISVNATNDITELIAADSLKACANTDVALNVKTYSNGMYNWTGPQGFHSTSAQNNLTNIQPNQEGYYVVTLSLPGCSLFKDSIYLKLSSIPTLTPPADTTVCDDNTGISLLAKATGAGSITYSWYDKAVGGLLLASAAGYKTPALKDTTTYYVVAASNACIGSRMPVTVRVNPVPPIPTVSNGTICSGIDTVLTATAAFGNIHWYDAAIAGNLLKTGNTLALTAPSSSKTYYPRSELNGCYSAYQPLILTVKPSPNAPVIVPQNICAGNSATLTASSVDGLIRWYSDAAASTLVHSTAQFITPTLYDSTTYYARNTKNNCPSALKSVLVAVNPVPGNPVPGNVTICLGTDTFLTATSIIGQLEWYDAALNGNLLHTGDTLLVQNLNQETKYYAVNQVNGCYSARQVGTISVKSLPDAPQPYFDAPVCEGSDVPLRITIIQDGIYTWTGPGGFSTQQRTPVIKSVAAKDTGLYQVSIFRNGCSSPTASINLDFLAKENAQFAYSSSVYCLTGGSTTPNLSGTPGGIFSSGNGLVLDMSTGRIDLKNSKAGNYTVNYRTPGTCYDQYTQNINLHAAVITDFDFSGPYCTGLDTILLPDMALDAQKGIFTANPGGLKINASTGAITVKGSAANTYTITNRVNASGNCPMQSATSIFILNAAPASPVLSSNSPICAGDTLQLDLSNAQGAQIFWMGPNNFKSNSSRPFIAPAGMIWNEKPFLAYLSLNSCLSDTAEIQVRIDPLPVPDFSTQGEEPYKTRTKIDFLNASSGAISYIWDPGDGSAQQSGTTISHTYTNAGTYTIILTASSALGCSNSISKKIEIIDDFTPYLAIPDAFSPNEDGKNDFFQVDGRHLQDFHLSIFNRWGELMFESFDTQEQWDGKYKGIEVPTGVYIYVLKAKDLKNKDYMRHGTVSLTK